MDAPFVSVSDALRQSISSASSPTASTAVDTPVAAESTPADAPATPAAEPKSTPADPKFDSRMAKLAQQAQKIRQEQEAFKAQRESWATEQAELKRFKELQAIAKEDPVALAEAFGFKPDEYATVLMEKGAMSPDRRKLLEQAREINELKTWRQQQVEQAQIQQRNQLIQGAQREIQQAAEAAGDQFDLVRRTGAWAEVVKVVEKHYLDTMAQGEPEEMPVEEALAQVEAMLERQYAPLLESPKFRTRGKSAATSQAAASGSASARKPSGTISSNTMRGSATKPLKDLSERERMDMAGQHLLQQIYGRRG